MPSVILSSGLLERIETISFRLSVPSQEPPDGLVLEGFAVETSIGDVTLGEGETATVCLPASADAGEPAPVLYRYAQGWGPVPGSAARTVNGIESVCGGVSSFPSLLGVFAAGEVPEPPVAEGESGGGCSVVSDGAGGSGPLSGAFNLLLIISCLIVAVSRRRRRDCVSGETPRGMV